MNSEENRKIETEEIISKIFRDTKELKRDESNNEYSIFYLGKYSHTGGKRFDEMDAFSRSIFNVKKDEEHLNSQESCYYYKTAVDEFGSQLKKILSDTEEFVICVIPSHNKGIKPSGIREIAKFLCSYNRIDGTNCIYRTKDVPKKSTGGVRNLKNEIDSLSVQNEQIIKNKIVLLLDDVTTSGTTLIAGITILKGIAGAKEVVALALGKTTY